MNKKGDNSRVQKLRILLNEYLRKNILNSKKILIKSSVVYNQYILNCIKVNAFNYIRTGWNYQTRMVNFLRLPSAIQSIVYGLSSMDELIRLFLPPNRKLNAFKRDFESQLQRIYNSSEKYILSHKLEEENPTIRKEEKEPKIEVLIYGNIEVPKISPEESVTLSSSPSPSKDSSLIEIKITDEEYRKVQELRFEEFKKQQLVKEQKLREERLRKRKEEELRKKNHKVFSKVKR